ncbi:ATP-binding cassette domain-containing protein [Arthrobacter sp. R4]|jgi:ABC-type multidrug transport system ATPase subunit|uniref:ATP-binding cassette domain-containing protein n=1 Tax=Arthrobacter sp. R4 TaxID=644417 RepID=UPI003EDA4583
MKSLSRVDHAFGSHLVFDAASVDLPDRGVVALRGPNGCGKTTLLKLLGGVIATSCTEITRWRKDFTAVYLDTEFLTLDYLTVEEHLAMVRPLTLPSEDDWRHLLTEEMMPIKVGDLSLGQRQRLVLTVALALKNVDVLLLDEPNNGLDQQASLAARKSILTVGKSRLVLVATHEENHWTDYDLVVRQNDAVELSPTGARR